MLMLIRQVAIWSHVSAIMSVCTLVSLLCLPRDKVIHLEGTGRASIILTMQLKGDCENMKVRDPSKNVMRNEGKVTFLNPYAGPSLKFVLHSELFP